MYLLSIQYRCFSKRVVWTHGMRNEIPISKGTAERKDKRIPYW